MKTRKAKKIVALVATVALTGAIAVSFSACDIWSFLGGNRVNTYDVSEELGYENSNGDFLTSTSSANSEAFKMYEDAIREGSFSGSFMDFLRELNIHAPVDDSPALASALASAVGIQCDFEVRNKGTVTSGGAGVIYRLDKTSWDAYVITNYHVVYDADSRGNETVRHISDAISVYLYGGYNKGAMVPTEVLSATYVGGAMDYDIAVLRISGNTRVSESGGGSHTNKEVLQKNTPRAVVTADSEAVAAGQRCYAIGNPEGEGIAVTGGIISVVSEYIDIASSDNSKTLSLLEMRVDAAVNHGNSGGGLFNADGQLLGIVNARAEADVASGESSIDSFGYAIPSNLAISIAQNILDNASSGSRAALRATLGISYTVGDSYSHYDEVTQKITIAEKVIVNTVDSSSIFKGKLQANDEFVAIRVTSGGNTVRIQKDILRDYHLTTALFNVRLNDTVELTVRRGGSTVTVSATYSDIKNFTVFS